jgi:hypothetical protein
MVPPSQLPVGPPSSHPHAMYRAPQRNQLQQQQLRSGYQHGYPPPQQGVALPRYGPPTMHAMVPQQQQQHTRVHHRHNHSTVSTNYRHTTAPRGGVSGHPPVGPAGHHHFHPSHVVVAGAPHGMVPLQQQNHHCHQYPPRNFLVPHHSAQQQHQHYSTHIGNQSLGGLPPRNVLSANPMGNVAVATSERIGNNEIAASTYSKKTIENDPEAPSVTRLEEQLLLTKKPPIIHVDHDSNNQGSGKAPERNDDTIDQTPRPEPSFSDSSEKSCIDSQVKLSRISQIKAIATGARKTVTMVHRNASTVMSPITMCFERMLGAGKL